MEQVLAFTLALTEARVVWASRAPASSVLHSHMDQQDVIPQDPVDSSSDDPASADDPASLGPFFVAVQTCTG